MEKEKYKKQIYEIKKESRSIKQKRINKVKSFKITCGSTCHCSLL